MSFTQGQRGNLHYELNSGVLISKRQLIQLSYYALCIHHVMLNPSLWFFLNLSPQSLACLYPAGEYIALRQVV